MTAADLLSPLVDQALETPVPSAKLDDLAALKASTRFKTVADMVHDHDLQAAIENDKARFIQDLPEAETSAEERALDGVAHYVFNTLRGAHPLVPIRFEEQPVDQEGGAEVTSVPVEWATFEDVKALIVAKGIY